MKLSKRTVLWIVPLLIIGAFYYFYGPKDAITKNDFIDYVKQQSLVDNSDISAEKALKNYCKDSNWVFFKTQRGQNVVEFKGECPVQKNTQPVNIQFIINEEKDDMTVGVMLLNHVQQSPEDRDKYLQLVYAN
ncbi:glucosamine 6-phosphate synthetase [Lysinibacillus sp. 54212]|uniref:glucosamine 6-phosphate synthetase n=1 Tax=Lysinibacillus sp. 54212 TaxID=3119829 RepID=UPI002FC6F3E3